VQEAQAVAAAMQTWFRANQRDLPWRRTHDPYHVLLSEFILQQTRMEVGLRYFDAILARFPTIRHLARARESSVLAAWSGLGYYSRARNLHRTANQIVARFGGLVPNNVETLRTLPGIGPYTAGAIASIAFDQVAPSIDGNQTRVLSRLLGRKEPASAAQARDVQALATSILRAGSPRAINQAFMDLGSSICTPVAPRCGTCPLAAHCKSRGTAGTTRRRGPAVRRESWTATLHVRGARVWLVPPSGQGLLGDSWLPPMAKTRRRGAALLEHQFSHRRWLIHVERAAGAPKGAGRWVSHRQLPALPHSSLTIRLMDAAQTGSTRKR
jgi:A/G-specific adenine glycosylase